jgi:hypothetical protein
MRVAGSEIEYLSRRANEKNDTHMIEELSRRLDALRCFDQLVCESDWQPRSQTLGCAPTEKLP